MPKPSAMAPASAIGPPMLGRAERGDQRLRQDRQPLPDDRRHRRKWCQAIAATVATMFQAACATNPATPSPHAGAVQGRRTGRPRSLGERHAGRARLLDRGAPRLQNRARRRCSRLSLMVVRMYLCHSKPSGFFRLPNMAVLPQAVETRNARPPNLDGAGRTARLRPNWWRTWDAETARRSTGANADASIARQATDGYVNAN